MDDLAEQHDINSNAGIPNYDEFDEEFDRDQASMNIPLPKTIKQQKAEMRAALERDLIIPTHR